MSVYTKAYLIEIDMPSAELGGHVNETNDSRDYIRYYGISTVGGQTNGKALSVTRQIKINR